jgi:SAM-dependent methyltransferase
VSEQDRLCWDERYAVRRPVQVGQVGCPAVFAPFEHLFPTTGRALEVACGQGLTAVWLARRGMDAWGVDVSGVAIGQARDLARRSGVDDRCRFDVVDLDGGLPSGPPVDLLVCHKFRDSRLDREIIGRLSQRGMLAISALSEVGAAPGPFRAGPGELRRAFGELDVLAAGEGDGEAWLLAKARLPA